MPGPIGAEDLYRFRWIDHVRLSRDGERVAYQLAWADADSRQNRSRVVHRRLLDPEPVEPTGAPRRDHSPEWSPDGRRLAFMSRVGAVDQLFVVNLTGGGETRQLTSVPEGAANPVWSPDGSRIAFIGTVISDPEAIVDDPRPPESKEVVRRAPIARVARRLDYKHDGSGFVDGRYRHLFVVPAGGGNVTQLTSGAWDVTGFDWSPDGTRFVVSGNAEPGSDLQRELNLYLVDLAGNRRWLGGGLLLSSPVWSPRGDLIAFIAPNGLDAGLLDRLWTVPLTGDPPRCLTANFDQGLDDSVINDMRAGHGIRLRWSAEGDRIYFLASGPGVTGVYSSDLDGTVRQEAGGQRRIFDYDVASGVIAFAASDPSGPGELHMLTQGAEARLTDLNPWLHDRYIAQPERHQFTAPDGWIIEGWVLKPEGLDPSKVYPLVMEVHGGPHAQYGWTFFHELQILAGMGYVVLCVNPRGSDGYGERFRREVVRDWGGKDYADLMSALDQLIERTGFIDTNRMGIGGGSYGGYMTNWAIGQTDRFSAAVSMRSISNLVSEYAQHDIVLWGVLELGAPPWPDLDELWRRSPIRYVKNIRTPLLLTHGEMDLRCAISQAEELFGAMRLLGKTVEMVRFPEESHDLSRAGRPDRRVERLRRIAGWYERFLGTAATDRVVEEETQVLPVLTPAVAQETHEVTSEASEVAPEAEAPSAELIAVPEPDVAETMVLQTLASAEAEIGEPEALPNLPELESEPEPTPEQEATPELFIAAETEPEPRPEPVEAVQMTEPDHEPHPEVEPVVAAAQTDLEAEPELPAARPWLETAQLDAESEPEPVIAAAEPEPETEPEPVVAAETPEPEPEPVAALAEPEPEPEPEPVVAAAAEPEPVAQAPVAPSQPTPPDAIKSTMLRWPGSTAPGLPTLGNGSPTTPPETFEEATSIIPAWQHTDPPSDSTRTVSLQALPLEQIAAGAGYSALLTFESGPFAGRIVALPSQMVTVGRAPDNDVVVGDPATSGHHGRIEPRSGSFWVSDLGSTNGTLINGEPVIEKQLSDGDLIAIGQNTIRFTLEG
ncbi:MAG TPA: prolyl oligopeptidase family serine peptidase [Candidatus Nitrosotalea sp.]|nr:prolyl oligopeptidase family serine peptidase [Candidatus Nitrosotalea sp.]